MLNLRKQLPKRVEKKLQPSATVHRGTGADKVKWRRRHSCAAWCPPATPSRLMVEHGYTRYSAGSTSLLFNQGILTMREAKIATT